MQEVLRERENQGGKIMKKKSGAGQPQRSARDNQIMETWSILMELLLIFLAKGQHQQGRCGNVKGSLADPLHLFGCDGR